LMTHSHRFVERFLCGCWHRSFFVSDSLFSPFCYLDQVIQTDHDRVLWFLFFRSWNITAKTEKHRFLIRPSVSSLPRHDDSTVEWAPFLHASPDMGRRDLCTTLPRFGSQVDIPNAVKHLPFF